MEFTLADVYAHAGSLAKLHPQNRHVRDKSGSNSSLLELSVISSVARGTIPSALIPRYKQ